VIKKVLTVIVFLIRIVIMMMIQENVTIWICLLCWYHHDN